MNTNNTKMNQEINFRQFVRNEFQTFLDQEAVRFPKTEFLKMDLHCHDYNSDVPDELWGRILRLPETWVSSEDVLTKLRKAQVGAMTITNHNNARSCWDLLNQGKDILAGAEFTCHFRDMNFDAHVLAYGFTPEQEVKLERLRQDAYKFLEYTVQEDIPTVLPHPLYLYHEKTELPIEHYEKLALLFERFEVMNGQRDVFQNLLVKEWMLSLTPEKLEQLGKKHGIAPGTFCKDPYRKRMTGGSDDHFALFVGGAGTLLHVPDLSARLAKGEKSSQIALQALRQNDLAPYGTIAEDEKLTIAFLDYFCQVAENMQDPGLLRLFLHRGDLKDKLICLGVSNAMQEMRRHKYTMKFLSVFHDSLRGRKPGMLTALSVSKDYRPLLDDLGVIAKASMEPGESHEAYVRSLESMFRKINQLISKRVSDRLGKHVNSPEFQQVSVDELVRRLELPSHFRMLSTPAKTGSFQNMSTVSVSDLFDQLSFPALFYGIMGGARFMSARVLYHDRATVKSFAKNIGKYLPPEKILWLTDTLYDKNGVASVLRSTLKEAVDRNLPIDFLICSNEIQEGPHLKVVPSMGSFALENFSEQKFNFPNLMDIHKIFLEGGYDRIVCSTEALMGFVALYLQQAFSVPAYMYMHTDWLDYVQRMTDLDTHALDRVRRMLRAFYRSFDGVFVLNTEHRDWLTSRAIGMSKRKVFLTAHWTDGEFAPPSIRTPYHEEQPVLLYAGRLSQEKGVLDLPDIMNSIRKVYPKAILRVAGVGVAEPQLRERMPDAEFLGWVKSDDLARIYGEADFLLLPSRFDTFGCVVTEAMACGLPVAAYDTKGPRDIIQHGQSGVLGQDAEELAHEITRILQEQGRLQKMRSLAIARSKDYDKTLIMNRFLSDIGLGEDYIG